MISSLRNYIKHNGGNIAVSFAILLVPMITVAGMSLDYVRAYNIRSKMQFNLDSALLAAVKSVGTLDDDAIEEKIKSWFAAQAAQGITDYSLSGIEIDTTNQEITANATLSVPTTLLQVADIDSIDVGVTASVEGAGEKYLNVYIVLDKSASMLLAATTAGQAKMVASGAKCAFACHTNEGTTYTYNNKSYKTVYALAKAMNVELRTDVSLEAVEEVLDMIDTYDSSHKRIKVGLYTLGETASQILAPTLTTSKAHTLLSDDSSGLTSATSEAATYFDYSMAALKKLVGTAGDGESESSPLKLVLLLTDGVQSERNWVLQTSSGIRFPTTKTNLRKAVTPINPEWCDDIKDLDASLGVLYTEYLPITTDWGYNATLAQTMSSSVFASVWDGTITTGYGSKSRLSYIPVALADCVSSSDLYIQANSSDEITAGLSTLFQQYLNKVRLTK